MPCMTWSAWAGPASISAAHARLAAAATLRMILTMPVPSVRQLPIEYLIQGFIHGP
jgi:hypothetical protein